MATSAPRVLAWTQRMLNPTVEGDLEPWDTLAPGLEPLLSQEVAGLFLPWSTANARVVGAGGKTLLMELEGTSYEQEAQKYHAKSLAALRARYAAVCDKTVLDPILERTGCRQWLG
jgi:hypothetical protein